MIIHKLDNVEVNLSDGHKYALRDIKKGENIVKYGNPIGHATTDIKKGEIEARFTCAIKKEDYDNYSTDELYAKLLEKFKYNEFEAIVPEGTVASEDEYVRNERATVSEIIEVKTFVEEKLGKPQSGNILYHLDDAQLKNYTEDEITQILAY